MKQPKKISQVCFAIYSRGFGVVGPSIRTTKRRCIKDYMALRGNQEATWRQLKRWGWRCFPVTISFYPPPGAK